MKPVNFIKPITPQAHRSLVRWYRGTITLLLMLMVGIVATTLKQILDARYVHHQKSMLTPHSTVGTQTEHTQKKLMQEEQTLKERLTTVKSWSEKQQQPATLLKALHTAVSQAHMTLVTFTLSTTHLELITTCSDPQAAVQLAQSLTKISPLHGVKLASLQPNKVGGMHSYRATITSRIHQA